MKSMKKIEPETYFGFRSDGKVFIADKKGMCFDNFPDQLHPQTLQTLIKETEDILRFLRGVKCQ